MAWETDVIKNPQPHGGMAKEVCHRQGTDFSRCSRGDIRKLEEIINGIHRHSPNPVHVTIKANRHGAQPEKSGIRVAPNRNLLLDRESAIEPTPTVTSHYQ